jgi:hypothetical protein
MFDKKNLNFNFKIDSIDVVLGVYLWFAASIVDNKPQRYLKVDRIDVGPGVYLRFAVCLVDTKA